MVGRTDPDSGPRIVRHLEVALVELGKAQNAVREPFDVELPEAPSRPQPTLWPVQKSARPGNWSGRSHALWSTTISAEFTSLCAT